MFREESLWINAALSKIKPLSLHSEVANIGSSTGYFRQVTQPHIHNNIIYPLALWGWNVVNIDMKEEDGVDLVADVTSNGFSENHTGRFDLTICTNLLEHVEDINLVIKNLVNITRNNGYVLLTVPNKYRLHYDPIDNGFRPTPFEIASRFLQAGTPVTVVDDCIIQIEDRDYYRIRKSKIPFWGYRERIQYHFGKRHKVAGILLQIEKFEPVTIEQKMYYRGKKRKNVLASIKSYFF